MVETIIVVYVIHGVILGAFCTDVASVKGRSAGNWFVLGFLFGIIALIAIVGQPSKETREEKCPSCLEPIYEEAVVCPHCQRDLPETERVEEEIIEG